MSQNKLVVTAAVAMLFAVTEQIRSAELLPENQAPANSTQADSPDEVLGRIRNQVQELLATPQPKLYERHLRSVLALCEDSVLKLQFAGPDQQGQSKELLGYLETIEAALKTRDAVNPGTYLTEGRRSLDLARLSQSDGTLQLYSVSLPVHWNPEKAYPLYVQLHGRWSDLPLALVASSLGPPDAYSKVNEDAIILVPWVRGNSEYRNENGSEPDIWEAIDDLKIFAKLDPDRWYLSGHSWGGDDTWAIVLRTPDRWAAAGIMAGDPESVPRDSGLVPNARHVPFYLWKGANDPVPNRQSSLDYFRDALTAVGDPPKVVVADGAEHMYRPQDAAAMQSWLFEHTRSRPGHFSFVIDTTQHRGIWGVSIPQKYPGAYLNVEPKVSFECWIEGSTVRIQTANSDHLDVDLGREGLNMSGNVKVVVNGKQLFDGPVPTKPLSLAW
ncbi:MAG: hypothetical protein ACLP07_07965 [Terracidiphilus sp.]